ncbi:MAG: hypothetical protein ING19_04870 [Azospirillum sp.]|nr:hypothetical protein [Azospirillum sp.]
MRHWRGLAVGLGASLMAGCGFSTGFTPGVAADTPPDASVVVALTEARFLRVHTTRAQAPLPWPEAATRLASEGRAYWE